MSDLMDNIQTVESHETKHTSIKNGQFLDDIKKKKSNLGLAPGLRPFLKI